MSRLRLYLFGIPRLERDGELISISRRKGLAMLAYIALRGQPQSREGLATLLWPEFDQSRALSNLRRELSRLKSDLEDEVLAADRLQIALVPDAPLWVDVEAFRRHIALVTGHDHHFPDEPCEGCRTALEEAAALHTERFLEGFNLPDAPEFDDWQFFEAEALSRAFGDALHRLIRWHAGTGEYKEAIPYGRRWLALDTLHEPAHRELMALYARAGQQAAALRQYEECVRLFEEELGIEPEPETTALYRAIRTRQFPEEQDSSLPSELAAPAAKTLLPPDSPERYQLEERIAVGGQGEVFLARDQVAATMVIVKRLRPELASDSARVERFLREGQLLGQLDHPNIVRMLAAFEREGHHCLVMEYVSGGTLAGLLSEQGMLPVEQTLSLALEIADALGRAHHLGIIHRDLKPGNVLLTEKGAPRLTDFGTARLEREDVRLTQTGTLVGSPAYMSPEALRGAELDPRSDIWSFGVLLYEMLAGRRPFEGETITQILVGILDHPAPALASFRADLPPALIDLIEKMLAKGAAHRPATMRRVAAELEAIRDGKWEAEVAVAVPSSAPSGERLVPQHTTSLPSRPFAPADQRIRFTQASDGTSIGYAVVGHGPPLVKVANPLTHLQYDWESPVWRHWVEALSREHTLVRYDERGCGLSQRKVNEFSMDAWVRDLEAVVDDLGLERFPIIGTSQGASVAIAYAVRHPERVSHVICCGGYARGRFHRELTPEQRAENETLLNLIRLGWGKENPAFRQVFASLFVPDGTPEQHRWFTELARITAEPETAARMERAFYDIDVTELAGLVQAPTLVLHPRGDQMVPFAEGRLLADLIPDANFVPLESNNHLLLADEPAWTQFLGEISRFLDTAGAAVPRQWTGFTPTGSSEPERVEQEIRFCQAPDGVQIAYASVGTGPPLVKAANWLSHLEYDWKSPVWHHWLDGLSRQHRLIRYDERGCGLSDRDVADMSFEAWIRDLESVVAAAGVDRFPLLGISQGAAIAVAYAYRHPERISHLILYGGYARGKLHRPGNSEQEVRVLSDLIRMGWGQEHDAFRQVFTSLFLPEGTPTQFNAFNELQRISSSPENAARIVEGFSRIDVSDLATQLQVPTLVLHAQGDLRIPFAEGRHLASLIPDARFVPLESKNHILLEHEPAWLQFLEEVHLFLRTSGVSGFGGPRTSSAVAPIPGPSEGVIPVPERLTLPASADPLIGRERELADIEQLLAGESRTRLLTLVGPGGIGKTRLATTVAEELVSDFPDGVTFVPLASLNESRQIVIAIAERVGLEFFEAGDKQEQLFHFLEGREQLLILDNFEHLLDGISLVEALLAQIPELAILATSREPLNVSNESVYRLAGLAYPEESVAVDSDPTSFGAVALLLQQLRRYRPELAPDPAEWQQLFRISRLVSGMPLALVLAANWVELLTLEEIGDEIAGSFDLLEADLRDLPARQQSMRAVFNASWEMLGETAQGAMARLGVFRGPFSRAAAQAVADCSLLTLRALHNKSWLQRRDGQFELHDLVRQYAVLKLRVHPGAEEEARAAHADYYVRLLGEQAELMKGPQQQEAFARVNSVFEQAGATWLWLLAQDRLDTIVHRLLPALYRYCEGRARASELFPLLERALDHPAADENAYLRAILLAAKSVFFISGQPIRFESMGNFVPFYWEDNKTAWQLAREQEIPPFWQIVICYSYGRVADAEEAIAFLESLLERLRAQEEEWLLAFGLQHLALLMQIRDSDGAEVAAVTIHLTEALAIMERLGDIREAAYTMRVLGYLWLRQGELSEAIAQWQQALARLQQVGDWIVAAQIHWHIGDAYLQLGQVDTAFRYYRAMSEMAVTRGNRRFAANVVSKESYEAARYGRLDLALQTRKESLALARAANDLFVEGWCLWEMGELHRLRGEPAQAADWFERSLHQFNRTDDNAGRCFYHRGLADLARGRGDYEMARVYYGHSLDLAEQNGHDWAQSYALAGLAQTSLALGEPEEAATQAVGALALATDTGDRAIGAVALVAAAGVLAVLGNQDLALEIATLVADHPVSWHEVRERAQQLQTTVRLAPSRIAVAQLQARGKALWEVVDEARLALADPAVAPVTTDGYSLPAYAIPFVGREKEVARLRRLLLAEPDRRLVTIIGPGGIGKTRLALQAAAQVRVSLPHGICFVPLAPLSGPEQIVPALASALNLEVRGDGSPRKQILNYLRDKELLLILDNFEHLMQGAGLANDILQAAPNVVILVTSREALGVSGETVISLGGLAFPASAEEEGDFPAVSLFLEQVRRLQPTYEFSGSDYREAARISQLVEGMPLALVLAAGWSDLLSLEEIAAEVATSFDFLESDAHDLPPRQRSIRGTFTYSWRRLSPAEQQTFARLSVFRGGFTRPAARMVADASLRTLRSLVNKSFLTAVPGERYEIHALLHQYGEAELEATGAAETARRRHGSYYLQALAALTVDLKGERQQQVLDEMAADIHNVRAALLWAAAQGEIGLLKQALESVYLYYDIPLYGRRHEEGVELFGRVLEKLPARSLINARFLVRQIGWQAELRRNAPAQVRSQIERCLAHFEAEGATADIAFSLNLLAEQELLVIGDSRAALPLFEQSLAEYRKVDARYEIAHLLVMIGYCHGSVTDLAHYREYVQQALAMSREAGNRRVEAFALNNLATVAFCAGAYDDAASRSEEALRVAAPMGLVGSIALAEGGIALARILRGELEDATAIAERGLRQERKIQWRPAVLYGMTLRGLTAAFAGEYVRAHTLSKVAVHRAPAPYNLVLAHWVATIANTGLEAEEQAWEHLHAALEIARSFGYNGPLIWLLPVATVLLARAGRSEKAVELLALASTHPLRASGWMAQWPLLQKIDERLALALGEPGYSAAWERGRTLDLAEAVADLLAAGPGAGVSAASATGTATSSFATRFVGRRQELAWLEKALESTVAGHGRVCFVIGEAGQGKSTLLRAFIRQAQARYPQLVAATGHCNAYSGHGDPYLPFREILHLLTGDVDRDVAGSAPGTYTRRLLSALPRTLAALVDVGPSLLDTFLPSRPLLRRVTAHVSGGPHWLSALRALAEANPAAPATEALLGQNTLFSQYIAVLAAVARQQPLMLFVDDLQWSDPGSANLLLHLGKQVAELPVLLLGAYRPAELATGRAGERHPLQQVVHELQRDYGSIVLDLGESDGHAFISDLLDAEPHRLDDNFRTTLYAQTRGHPLFTVELLRGMQERGDLQRATDGAWIAGYAIDWEMLPARIEGAIGERVDRLEPALRELLLWASVVGEIFSVELLAHLDGRGPHELAHLFGRELGRRHRLVQAIGVRQEGEHRLSRYRFRHILIQRYLYQTLDDVERAYRHEAVARAFETLFGAEAPAMGAELARHFVAARLPAQAAPYFRHAGDHARHAGALAQAIEHYTQALLNWSEADAVGRARLRHLLGECTWITGQLSVAHAHFESAYEHYLALNDVVGAGAAQRAIGRLFWEEGNRQSALDHSQQALNLLEQGPETVELARAYSAMAQMHMLAWEHEQSVAWGERALALARRLEAPPDLLSHALNNAGISTHWLGKPEEALAMLQESKTLAIDHHLPHDACRAFYNIGSVLLSLDRSAEAWTEFNGLREYAERWQVPLYAGSAYAELFGLEWISGHWRSALGRLPGIQRWLERGESLTYLQILFNLIQATVANTLGRAEDALSYLAESAPAVERINEAQMWMPYLDERIRALALLGRHEEAAALFDQLLAFDGAGFVMLGVTVLSLRNSCHWAAEQGRWEEAGAVLGRIEEIANRFDSQTSAAVLQECQGLIAFHRDDPEEAVRQLRLAAEGWQRLERPYDEARVCIPLARALAAAGEDDQVPAVRVRAGQLLQQLTAELDDEQARADFRAAPLVRAAGPVSDDVVRLDKPVPQEQPPDADGDFRSRYQPLLTAVEQAANRQEQDGRGTETNELRSLVSELQASLAAVEAERERMDQLAQELALARQVQQRMLPDIFPEIPGYDFATRYAPARAVGGDFYDVIPLDDDRFAVVIADVSGKGMPAALLMTLTRSLLLSEAPAATSPRALLERVNDLLLMAGDGEVFVTLFYGVLERAARRLTYARAGHDYPILLRDGQAMELDGTGLALGVLPGNELQLQECTVDLEPEDRLILYSDGLTDVRAPDGEMYDRERLQQTLLLHAPRPAEALCEAVFAELATFQAGASQHDDMTMLVVEVAPADGPATVHSRPATQSVDPHR